MNWKTLISMALVVGAIAPASATTWRWTWDKSPTGYNAAAGKVQSATATYNEATQQFTYEVKIGKADNGKLPNMIYLALNDGPNPKGIAGELPIFFLDATTNNPVLTAYGYNGLNTQDSWRDGSPAAGIQAPDRIRTSKVNPSNWINNLSVSTVNNVRTFKFDIKGQVINQHDSPYGTAADWNGVKFREKFGIWFGTLQDAHTSYNHQGYLNSLSFGKRGWIDLSHQTAVPEPATMTALALGAAAALRRRKAKKA